MSVRMLCLAGFLTLSASAFTAWSLTRGQEPVPAGVPAGNATTPPAGAPAVLYPALQPMTDVTKSLPARDPAKLSPLGKQMYLNAQRGADWLFRANRPDGRFDYGYIPALKSMVEGDHYLRQAGAAFALARAARLTGDDRYTAIAKQAVLALLLDTTLDPNDKQVRYTALPSIVVNRLAAAGLLVLAINELPAPADDLLDQSEQLCAYIRKQQQPDGSLSYVDNPNDPQASAQDADGINCYPGEALYGLMRSQEQRRAEWKTDVVRKALTYYRPWWQKNKNMAMVPWQTAAYAEAYLLTQGKEPAFAEFVNEMSDWICGMQYNSIDPKHPLWVGGFMSWEAGRPVQDPPQIGSTAYAEGLTQACRVARQAADLNRHQRFREAAERSLQFAATLQYTEANTQHFADWYRTRLVGGFHASHQDGNLRIDYTQQAVSALALYLMYAAD